MAYRTELEARIAKKATRAIVDYDMIQDGDRFGEGVSLAVRLQSQAPAGGLAITKWMHDYLAGKVDLAFTDIPRIPLFQPYSNVAMQKNVTGYQYWFHRRLDYRAFTKA